MNIKIIRRVLRALRTRKDIDSYVLSDSIKAQVMSRHMTAEEINRNWQRARS